MNRYCQHKVRQFFESYRLSVFDQDDVALFILLTRDYSGKGSVIRELGDFLAHPDRKDRGIVLENVSEAADNVEENYLSYLFDENFEPPVFEGLCRQEDLCSELKKIFTAAGIVIGEDEVEAESEQFRDFIFCIIFLLSAFKIKLGGRLFEFNVEYSHGLSLYISYQCIKFPRFFVHMPVLFLRNVWVENISPFGGSKFSLENHIARRFKEGFLGAIAYEDDPSEQPLDASKFERGKVWPLIKYRS